MLELDVLVAYSLGLTLDELIMILQVQFPIVLQNESETFYDKNGRIVSKKKHTTAKKEKCLEKHGYFAKKGKFGYVRTAKASKKVGKAKRPRTRRRRSRKKR